MQAFASVEELVKIQLQAAITSRRSTDAPQNPAKHTTAEISFRRFNLLLLCFTRLMVWSVTEIFILWQFNINFYSYVTRENFTSKIHFSFTGLKDHVWWGFLRALTMMTFHENLSKGLGTRLSQGNDKNHKIDIFTNLCKTDKTSNFK